MKKTMEASDTATSGLLWFFNQPAGAVVGMIITALIGFAGGYFGNSDKTKILLLDNELKSTKSALSKSEARNDRLITKYFNNAHLKYEIFDLGISNLIEGRVFFYRNLIRLSLNQGATYEIDASTPQGGFTRFRLGVLSYANGVGRIEIAPDMASENAAILNSKFTYNVELGAIHKLPSVHEEYRYYLVVTKTDVGSAHFSIVGTLDYPMNEVFKESLKKELDRD